MLAVADFALAQEPATPPADPKAERRPLRAAVPDRAKRLDGLFEVLKRSPDAQISKVIEARIEAALLVSGSDTADLLMVRARAAVEAKDTALALELLDALIEFEPNFAEARARRATLLYMKKDVSGALADIRVTLAREPRHFGALTGLGVILQDIGDDKRALDALRRAIEVHPHLQGIGDIIKRLEVKVEGRDI
jgi:tetratricopeptide (TPR) repeat protein